MNSRTEFLAHLVMSVIIMLVVSVAAYYIGGSGYIGGDILKAAENAKAAGNKAYENVVIPKLADWQAQYFDLVLYMGLIAGFILILWVILTHWLLHSSGSTGQSKRWLWGLFGIILAVLCVTAPILFRKFCNTSFLIDIIGLPLLFFICYGLVGYWGGSIFVTSNIHKYTPIFSGFFR